MRYITLFFSFFLISMSGSAQQDTLGRYSTGFPFREGVYMSFEDFACNCPSILMGDIRYTTGEVVEQIDPAYRLNYMYSDSLRRLPMLESYGYCSNGQIYLRRENFFDRLIVIGSLSHLIHREEYIDYTAMGTTGFNNQPIRRERKIEYLLNMRTGEKMLLDPDNLSLQIVAEPIMLHDFERMNKKARKQSMYRILRDYNAQHPLYFPISGCR